MQVAYQTAIGKRRSDNQDNVGVFTNRAGVTLAIIADGIGGNQGGDVASDMAVSHFGHDFEVTDFTHFDAASAWLKAQVNTENDLIYKRAQEFADLKGMGTTVVMAMVFETELLIGNIGDSRAYLLRKADFSQLTEDHSLVNELVKRGELSKQAAKVHPQKNVITRSLGVGTSVQIDLRYQELTAGDQLLLCSDGLTNMVSDSDIMQVLQRPLPLATKCDELIQMANAAGGLDNISVIIIDHEPEVSDR